MAAEMIFSSITPGYGLVWAAVLSGAHWLQGHLLISF